VLERGLVFSLSALMLVASACRRSSDEPYIRQADGTVTDNKTRLTWQGSVSRRGSTLADALSSCSGRGAGWRLPSDSELLTLVDPTVDPPGPTINQIYFPNTPTAPGFWTSGVVFGEGAMPSALHPHGKGVYVIFYSGKTGVVDADSSNLVRCVRGPD
jgi:hypothetical protein